MKKQAQTLLVEDHKFESELCNTEVNQELAVHEPSISPDGIEDMKKLEKSCYVELAFDISKFGWICVRIGFRQWKRVSSGEFLDSIS